jgi:Family of unknown function (DUF6188)
VTVELGFAGEKLIGHELGFTVRLDFSGGYEVRVEAGFTVRTADGEHRVVPGGDDGGGAALDALTGLVVTVATADDAGGLRIDLDGGARVLAEADPEYEAWTVAGPGGMKVVSLPGGGLSVWSS